MKKLILVLFIVPLMASAQVFVNSSTMYSSGTILMPEKYVDYLKGAKTYFIVPESMNDEVATITETLKKVWTFNEIEAISLTDAGNVPAGKNAFFNISGFINEDLMFILMQLTIEITKPDAVFKKPGEQIFAGFYLGPDVGSYTELLKLYRIHGSKETLFRFAGNDKARQDYTDFYYKGTKFHNFHLGQICNYLAIINEALQDATIRARGAWGMMKVSDETEIGNLKTETLYIPDFLLKTQKMVMGSISTTTITEAELMADYKHTYKMVTEEEISNLILESSNPAYYLDFISTNLLTFMVIFNSKTHQAVYTKLLNTTIASSKAFKEISAKIDISGN